MEQDFSKKELYIIGCSLPHSILEQKKMLAELREDYAMYSNFIDWINTHEELLSKVARLQDITIRPGDNLKDLFKK